MYIFVFNIIYYAFLQQETFIAGQNSPDFLKKKDLHRA